MGAKRQIPRVLLEKARELRKQQTPAEEILWECLRDRRLLNLKFRRQHNIGQYIADFYCHELKLVIELDGGIHQQTALRDQDRDRWMQEHSIQVLRFKNEQIFTNLENILAEIAHLLSPSETPSETPSHIQSPLLWERG